MATVVQYPVQEEGDPLTAPILNLVCGAFPNLLVNTTALNLDRYALDSQHLPEQSFSNIFSNGYEAVAATGPIFAQRATYCNSLPMTASGGTPNQLFPYTYQSMDAVAGTGLAIFGGTQNASGHLYEGWRIPSENQTLTNTAMVTLNAATNFGTANISGVLCRAGVSVSYLQGEAINTSGTDQAIYTALPSAAIAIGWNDTNGFYHIVERSVRFYSGQACVRGNISTSTYLTQADLDTEDGTCARIFLAIATVRPTDIRAAKDGTSALLSRDGGVDNLVIEYYNLSTTPIRAGSL